MDDHTRLGGRALLRFREIFENSDPVSICRALQRIPSKEQRILHKRLWEGKGQILISSEEGISQPSVHYRIEKALDRIQFYTERTPLSEDAFKLVGRHMENDQAGEMFRVFYETTSQSETARRFGKTQGYIKHLMEVKIRRALEGCREEIVKDIDAALSELSHSGGILWSWDSRSDRDTVDWKAVLQSQMIDGTVLVQGQTAEDMNKAVEDQTHMLYPTVTDEGVVTYVQQKIVRLVLSVDTTVTMDDILKGLKIGDDNLADQNVVIDAIGGLCNSGVLVQKGKRYTLSQRLRRADPEPIDVRDEITFGRKLSEDNNSTEKVIEAMALVGGFTTVSSLSKLVGLSGSTTYSILKELEEEGTVYGVGGKPKRYFLSHNHDMNRVAKTMSPNKWVRLSISGIGGIDIDGFIEGLTRDGYSVYLSATDQDGVDVNVKVDETKIVDLMVFRTKYGIGKPTKPKKQRDPSIPNMRNPDEKRRYERYVEEIVRTNNGPISSTEIIDVAGGTPNQVRDVLKTIAGTGKILVTGQARATRYTWIGERDENS